MDEGQFKVVELQALYLMRPYCHAGEGFKDKFIENIQVLGLPESLEVEVLAKAIVSMRARREYRCELLNEMLDLIEAWKRITEIGADAALAEALKAVREEK